MINEQRIFRFFCEATMNKLHLRLEDLHVDSFLISIPEAGADGAWTDRCTYTCP